MHTESAYDGCTAYCYPEQGMVDHLLRVHIQSRRAFGPRWTLSYNMLMICFMVSEFVQVLLLVYIGVHCRPAHVDASRAKPCSVAKANRCLMWPAFQSALNLRRRYVCLYACNVQSITHQWRGQACLSGHDLVSNVS